MFKPLMATALKSPVSIVKAPRKPLEVFGATFSGIEYIESADLLDTPIGLALPLYINGHWSTPSVSKKSDHSRGRCCFILLLCNIFPLAVMIFHFIDVSYILTTSNEAMLNRSRSILKWNPSSVGRHESNL